MSPGGLGAGNLVEARRLLSDLDRGLSPVWFPRVVQAIAHLSVGDKDGALLLLEKGLEEKDQSVLSMKVQPDLDPIRSDPRYHKLLKRMNLE